MTIDKSFKVGIITSLIGSVVFLYLLDPILKLLSNLFFFFSDKVSSYFVDNLYREIALGKTDYSLTQMVIIIIAISTLFSFTIIRNITKTNATKDQGLKKRLASAEKTVDKSVWKVKILPIVIVVLINIVITLQLVSSYIKISSINTFEQRIRILAPYINEREKLLLISRFSSMKNYTDYLRIMLDIETIAKNNKIILPEQLYTYTY